MDYNMDAMLLLVTINMTTPLAGGEFNGAVFGDLDFGPGAYLAGLSLSSNDIPGFDASRMGVLSTDSFWLDFKDLEVTQGQSATVEFQTAVVPVPGAVFLGLIGLTVTG